MSKATKVTPVTVDRKKGYTANQVMEITGIKNREYVFELMRKGTLVVLKRKAEIKGERNLQTVMTSKSVLAYAKARRARSS